MKTTKYPLYIENQRKLFPEYNGPVYVWDIDKTYLSTHFSSLKGLARIPLEYAVDKVAIPGMPAILRGLRRGPGPEFACAPLYFVSASPVQMAPVLRNKMLIDGVEYDGMVLKDWVKTVSALRFGRLKEQLGYKLCALFSLKKNYPLASEYLFGDDYEKDAAVFSLYARLLSGETTPEAATEIMIKEQTGKEDRQSVFELFNCLPPEKGQVKKIFIHLEKKTPPAAFEHYGPLITPVRNAAQLALALYQLNKIDSIALNDALATLPDNEKRKENIEDAVNRDLITPETAKTLQQSSL